MADTVHPEATHHIPAFITAPGQTDVLMVVTAIILALAVLAFGVLFLRLHALPEQIAHKSHKVQMEIVAVLCLISLFTHMHIFWIAGLILAFIDIPDFGNPLRRIAGSVEKMAGVETAEATAMEPAAQPAQDAAAVAPVEARKGAKPDGTPSPTTPENKPEGRKELSHA